MAGARVLGAVAAPIVAVVVAVVVAGVVAGVAGAAAGPPAPSRLPPCPTSGPLPGLTDVQAENARIVAATADARLGPRAAVIVVMTALTESGLRILANPHDPSGAAYPNHGVGYDHDSLGLFQQRPSWGTAAARMDPVASTNLFLDALQAHRGWRAEPPWQVAQDVQRSAFDGKPTAANGGSTVYGGNYLVQHPRAVAIVADIDSTAAEFECSADTSPEGTSPPSRVHWDFPRTTGFPRDPRPQPAAR